MRILLVVHYYYPHIGGMEAVVEKQAKSLVRRGHEVTILTCRPDGYSPRSTMREGYRIQRIPALNFVEKRFGVTYPIVSPLYFFRLLRIIAAYDIVHIHDVFYMTSHMAALCCILQRKVFFLTQHVATVDYPSVLVMVVQRFMYGTFGRLLFSQAAKIICYNQIVKNFLLRSGVPESNIFQQYNGIDTTYFSPVDPTEKRRLRARYNLPSERPIVLFAGRLVPKKGFELVYQARSEDYLTIIAGDGKPPSHMKTADDVKLFGPATPSQLRDLYRLSDIFVFPAKGEIFTLVMQEAMASGLPVLTADDPGYIGYTLSRDHIQFVAREPEAIKAALKRIARDPARRTEMGEYAREFAIQHFDWERNYEHEYALYDAHTHREAATDG